MIHSLFYNSALLVGGLAALPKWLFQNKYKGTLKQRWGMKLPKPSKGGNVFWLHMVSMGETRAMIPIYEQLLKTYPHASFYFSSTTKTGYEEARRRFTRGAEHFFLPLDFSWTMKSLVKTIKPTALILSESDFWYHLIQMVKRGGGKVVVLNGKLSERSHRRFKQASFFSEKLFSPVDLFCVQNSEYQNRFSSLPISKEKVVVTGNLKLAIKPPQASKEEIERFCLQYGIDKKDRLITLGSTHAKEEELLVEQLNRVLEFKNVKFLLVPRHPERFKGVKKWLSTLKNDQIILIDQMGVLNLCYQLSEIAVVGGSFVPGVGGHNIFEPIQAKIPVLFGPFMETQRELVEMVLSAEAGLQIAPDQVANTLNQLLAQLSPYRQNATKLSLVGQEVVDTTWQRLKKVLPCG